MIDPTEQVFRSDPPLKQIEGSELLVSSRRQRSAADRAQNRIEPDAVLRRSSRRGMRLGGAAEDRAASADRRGAARRSARDGAGDRGAALRRSGASGCAAKLLFAETREWVLLSHVVPVEWMHDVRASDRGHAVRCGGASSERGCRASTEPRHGRAAPAAAPRSAAARRRVRASRGAAPLPRHSEP